MTGSYRVRIFQGRNKIQSLEEKERAAGKVGRAVRVIESTCRVRAQTGSGDLLPLIGMSKRGTVACWGHDAQAVIAEVQG